MQPTKFLSIGLVVLSSWSPSSFGQGSTFQYSAELTAKGLPAHGNFDMEFRLYDVPTNGVQVGVTLFFDAVAVRKSRFNVLLAFGTGAFSGEDRWLEVAVRDSKKKEIFTVISPRQQLTPVPYAIHATTATSVTGPIGLDQLPAGVAYLGSNQTFTGVASFAPSTGPPFSVGSPTKVTQLNADLVDGLDSNAFAAAAHTHAAADLVSGLIPDQRLAGTYTRQITLSNRSNVLIGAFSGNGSGLTNLSVPDATAENKGLVQIGSGLALTGGVVSVTFGTNRGTAVEGNDPRLTSGWRLAGNGGTTPASAFLGTTDNQPLEFRVNNIRALRLEPTANVPNIVAGSGANIIASGVIGASIGGGHDNVIAAGADYANIPGGFGAIARVYGQRAYANGSFSSPGDAQTSIYILRGTITGQGSEELFLDGINQRVTVPRNSVWILDARFISKGEGSSSIYTGYIDHAVVYYAFDGVRVAYDQNQQGGRGSVQGSNDTLIVRGQAFGPTARWVAVLRTVEVSY